LITAEPSEVANYFEEMASDARDIKKQVIEICWYMRGSVTHDQAWQLTYEDKKIIGEFIKENQEKFKNSMTPVV
jgi:hypothetical protein